MKPIKQFQKFMRRFSCCERGSTSLEYGLIMALIFLVILGAITIFSEVATDKMQTANEAITGA